MEDYETDGSETFGDESEVDVPALEEFILKGQVHLINAFHYMKYVHKIPCYIGKTTGYEFMMEMFDSEVQCMNTFRMEKHVFVTLCEELQNNYGLRPSKNMTVLEKVGIFLHIIAGDNSNRDTCNRFQRSGDTVSRSFHQVLDALVEIGRAHV